MESKYLSILNAAALIDVKPRTIRYWCHKGILKFRRFGKHIRILKDDLEQFGIEENKIINN